MKKLKQEYLQLAKLLEQENQLRKKLQALQAKRLGGEGRFTCTERNDNGIVLHIPLPELMALFPETPSELIKWTRDDGSVQAYHRFGPAYVGDIKPGFHFWVKHETKVSEVVPAPLEKVAAAA